MKPGNIFTIAHFTIAASLITSSSCQENNGTGGYSIATPSGIIIPVTPVYKMGKRSADLTQHKNLSGILYLYTHPRYIHLFITGYMKSRYLVVFMDDDNKITETGAITEASYHGDTQGITSKQPSKYALVTKYESGMEQTLKKGDRLSFNTKLSSIVPEKMPSVAIDGKKFYLEVADTSEERERGLMHRKRLTSNDGMLFIFQEPRELSFWMRNTLIPLTIFFIREDGTVDSTYNMPVYKDPQHDSEPSYPSNSLCKYALELNQGVIPNPNRITSIEIKY